MEGAASKRSIVGAVRRLLLYRELQQPCACAFYYGCAFFQARERLNLYILLP
jgi:hypothetical protein